MKFKKNKRLGLENLGQVSTVLASLTLPTIIGIIPAYASPTRPRVTSTGATRPRTTITTTTSTTTSTTTTPSTSLSGRRSPLASSSSSSLLPDNNNRPNFAVLRSQLRVVDSSFDPDSDDNPVYAYIIHTLYKNEPGCFGHWTPEEITLAKNLGLQYRDNPTGFRETIQGHINSDTSIPIIRKLAEGLGITKSDQ